MAITTMQIIAKQTVGASGAASITFSNIPQTFTDLKVVMSARTGVSGATDAVSLSINGSNSNLSGQYAFWNGNSGGTLNSGTAVGTQEAGWINGGTSTASSFSNVELYFPNYTSTTTSKSYTIDSVHENNAATGTNSLYIGPWANVWNPGTQAAITSLTFTPSASFSEYSTIYLYGISKDATTQNALSTYATGGDVITTDGTYWYHTFLYSGTFTPSKDLDCDYLVVAGGASGGRLGGGGAGGYRTSIGGTALSLIANTGYTATIGAGGAATTNSQGFAGTNSVFSTITSTGGGYGGGEGDGGGAGGSGGGSGPAGGAGAGNTPSTTPSQGNSGGIGYVSSNNQQESGGGGGGAGSTGYNAPSTSTGGVGGDGATSSISGTSVTRAGGGGGGGYIYLGTGGSGAGGTGGGGSGGRNGLDATNATVNSGSGGGGNGFNSSGNLQGASGKGGSGIVIVRYAV